MTQALDGRQARLRLRRCRTSAATSSPRATTTSSARRSPTATTRCTWMARQPWSNGKVGTIGCSSTAEWQMAVAAHGQSGVRGDERAGIRRRASAAWRRTTSRATGTAAAPCRCCSSPGSTASRTRCGRCSRANTSQEDLIRASKSFDLAQQLPPVDWSKALWHLPVQDIIKAVDGPHGIFADAMPVATGGRDDPARAERSGLVQGRALARQHADQRAGPLVHVVVRRVGRAEPRALQPRAEDGEGRDRRTSSGRSSRRSRTAPTRAPPRTPIVGEREHGRRAARLRRDRRTASSTAS